MEKLLNVFPEIVFFIAFINVFFVIIFIIPELIIEITNNYIIKCFFRGVVYLVCAPTYFIYNFCKKDLKKFLLN
jgi:hypothetical protein